MEILNTRYDSFNEKKIYIYSMGRDHPIFHPYAYKCICCIRNSYFTKAFSIQWNSPNYLFFIQTFKTEKHYKSLFILYIMPIIYLAFICRNQRFPIRFHYNLRIFSPFISIFICRSIIRFSSN